MYTLKFLDYIVCTPNYKIKAHPQWLIGSPIRANTSALYSPARIRLENWSSKAPRLQIRSIQPIKSTGSSPVKLRLHHRDPRLTQSKKITERRFKVKCSMPWLSPEMSTMAGSSSCRTQSKLKDDRWTRGPAFISLTVKSVDPLPWIAQGGFG